MEVYRGSPGRFMVLIAETDKTGMFKESTPLYTAGQVRHLDRCAIETQGIPGFDLMTRAGEAAWRQILARWAEAERVLVLCGPGNNGGDGYVIAALARAAGMTVDLIQLGETGRIHGDAATAREQFLEAGGRESVFAGELPAADLVVDALLGTGLERAVEGDFARAIEAANALRTHRIAVDIPSGLNADTGRIMGVAFDAELTVTFIGLKRGLYTGQAADVCGEVVFDDLGVPADTYTATTCDAVLLPPDLARDTLPARPRTAHKGHAGRLLIVGGDYGLGGAPRMAGEAALRTGAGLVSLATRAEHAYAHAAVRPELMCHPVDDRRALVTLLGPAEVIAVGPGLGREAWGRALLAEVLTREVPQVLDADALNLLAQDPRPLPRAVLTPHPGEAARLLACTVDDVERDRFRAVRELQRRFAGVVVLKGSGTLVASPGGRVAVCPFGNPGMASGGMGDVLTGVIGALMAQGLEPAQAAEVGVCLHAQAGDAAAAEGERGLIATDLMPWLRRGVNP